MVFSSIVFLYEILPILLLIYFLFKKNIILLLGSLFFYFYGETKYIYLIILSGIINYMISKLIEKYRSYDRLFLIVGLIIDFGFLFYFKYYNFFLENINTIFNIDLPISNIVLPLGISFYTFQASSYIIDVYKKETTSASSLLDFMTYLTLFPQLIAGPIVRYETIANELKSRTISMDDLCNGIERFILGLSKKVLIANVLGEVVVCFSKLNEQSMLAFFIIGLASMLQIYFDFSGYSDMAIGLGNMFGFHFLENFNYPFISKSITEFWRRWHMSLSLWLRDYIYIPLGGNRGGIIKQLRNIFIVWAFTGLWHGASWNFVLWGLYFALFLTIEKIFLLKYLNHHPILGHIYTLVIVYISFLIFNNYSLPPFTLPMINYETIFLLKNNLCIFIIAFMFSTPLIINSKFYQHLKYLICIILLVVCTSFIVSASYNPFLYFRF